MLQDDDVLTGTGTCYRMLLCCQGPEHVTGCCVVRDWNMLQDVVLSGTGKCYRMLLCCQGLEHVTGCCCVVRMERGVWDRSMLQDVVVLSGWRWVSGTRRAGEPIQYLPLPTLGSRRQQHRGYQHPGLDHIFRLPGPVDVSNPSVFVSTVAKKKKKKERERERGGRGVRGLEQPFCIC